LLKIKDMTKTKEKEVMDTSTEEKIKIAARTVFQKKGFAATRTRDIAEEATINLALLNYYFRSKEKLFEIIMQETMTNFFKGMIGVFNDESTVLEKKIELFVENYYNMLTEEPDILLFILGEIRNRSENFSKNLPAKQMLSSVFFQQFQEKAAKDEIKETNPFQFMMSLMGLTAFPFLVKPLITTIGVMQEEQFNQIIQERKKLIPVWIEAIMKAN
jgi:AcrR family transcriptional regulator